jgi:hypothetical protein
MRIVPFPGRDETGPEDAWQAELEAALSGEAEGAAADVWRELRADVRALAPAMTPEFECELGERLAVQGARGPRGATAAERASAHHPLAPAFAASAEPVSSSGIFTGPAKSERRRAATSRSRRRLGGLSSFGPKRAVLGAATVAALVVAVLIAGPLGAGNTPTGKPTPRSQSAPSHADLEAPAATHTSAAASRAANGTLAQSAPAASGGAASSSPATSGASSAGGEANASGRVQHRAAILSLSASATEVQTVADRVARLATNLGGFVQSSQVQVLAPQEGTSHAELDLRLPSAKLTAALAALGQLAPVRFENQSLQDITNAYNAARQRLGDAIAERQALLRALAGASTEGQIDSLRERLAQSRRAIAQAQSAFKAVSQRASTSEVEVTVLGDARAASEGLTLHRGLHDAGRVLVVTLAVLLIALAILVPAALLILALTSAHRAWLRYRRERVLDGT